jgi:CheY-like chemotaxis protein
MITNDAKNILIADDSIFFRTKLSAILNEAGHVVTYASDGREVIAIIAKLKENPSDIDIIILDLQMPHIDGFGVLEWMKQNGHVKKFPVLAVTGVYEPHDVIEKLKALGARGLMTKGFTPEQVIRAEGAAERSGGLHF